MFAGYGVGDPVVYWTLQILLLVVLIYCGWGISYDNSYRYKKYAWTAGVFYSLIQGLRWLRGADYPHYYNDIVTLLGEYSGGLPAVVTSEPELLYKWWCTIFYHSGLPFWCAFVFYSAILIWSVLLILKHYRRSAIWALPMFFILTPSAENLIRQYIAEALVIFAYYFYLEDKKRVMWLFLIAVPLIHFSGIIIVSLFIGIIYFSRPISRFFKKKWILWVMLLLFIYCYYFWNSDKLLYLVNFIENNVHLDSDKGSNYVDNAERWFSSEGSISNVLGTGAAAIGLTNSILTVISYCSIIYYGFKLQTENLKLCIVFLFSYLAIMLKTIGGDIEMFLRFYNWFVIFIPLIIGVFMNNLRKKHNIYFFLIGVYALNFLWYSFLRGIISTSMFGYGFIWDK